MNTAQKLRAMIKIIKDDEMDITLKEIHYRKRQLKMYLKALDDVQEKLKAMATEEWQDKHLENIFRELRG